MLWDRVEGEKLCSQKSHPLLVSCFVMSCPDDFILDFSRRRQSRGGLLRLKRWRRPLRSRTLASLGNVSCQCTTPCSYKLKQCSSGVVTNDSIIVVVDLASSGASSGFWNSSYSGYSSYLNFRHLVIMLPHPPAPQPRGHLIHPNTATLGSVILFLSCHIGQIS